MRKTIGVVVVLALSCILVSAQQAQQKAVSFKKLQEFLPKIELSDFTRGKPTGETSSMMGMSTSEATVMYEGKSGGDETPSIEVKISDLAGIPYAQMGLSMFGGQEFENETESGYEKSVKIQGFPGTERVETTEDSKEAHLQLLVGNRFMVEFDASGTSDVTLLRKLVDSMNLGELAKVTAQ
ncbi:MAG: hypothetical protein WAU81_06680 [Candidatus Aminicenantales bacterium]